MPFQETRTYPGPNPVPLRLMLVPGGPLVGIGATCGAVVGDPGVGVTGGVFVGEGAVLVAVSGGGVSVA